MLIVGWLAHTFGHGNAGVEPAAFEGQQIFLDLPHAFLDVLLGEFLELIHGMFDILFLE